MYQFKQEKLEEVINNNKLIDIASKVGISRVYLSYVLHNKYNCRKSIAYCITKALDQEKEIDYFFNEI